MADPPKRPADVSRAEALRGVKPTKPPPSNETARAVDSVPLSVGPFSELPTQYGRYPHPHACYYWQWRCSSAAAMHRSRSPRHHCLMNGAVDAIRNIEVEDGILVGSGDGWVATKQHYSGFEISLEYH